jgi:hypothetical protein
VDVNLLAFHAGNTGSNPVGDAILFNDLAAFLGGFCCFSHKYPINRVLNDVFERNLKSP